MEIKKQSKNQKKTLELRLIKKEVELKFNVNENELRHLYNTDYDKFKKIVNWLYHEKSLSINNIVRVFN